jgi:hypothetical protein
MLVASVLRMVRDSSLGDSNKWNAYDQFVLHKIVAFQTVHFCSPLVAVCRYWVLVYRRIQLHKMFVQQGLRSLVMGLLSCQEAGVVNDPWLRADAPKGCSPASQLYIVHV